MRRLVSLLLFVLPASTYAQQLDLKEYGALDYARLSTAVQTFFSEQVRLKTRIEAKRDKGEISPKDAEQALEGVAAVEAVTIRSLELSTAFNTATEKAYGLINAKNAVRGKLARLVDSKATEPATQKLEMVVGTAVVDLTVNGKTQSYDCRLVVDLSDYKVRLQNIRSSDGQTKVENVAVAFSELGLEKPESSM